MVMNSAEDGRRYDAAYVINAQTARTLGLGMPPTSAPPRDPNDDDDAEDEEDEKAQEDKEDEEDEEDEDLDPPVVREPEPDE
jgi:hypothetical protein